MAECQGKDHYIQVAVGNGERLLVSLRHPGCKAASHQPRPSIIPPMQLCETILTASFDSIMSPKVPGRMWDSLYREIETMNVPYVVEEMLTMCFYDIRRRIDHLWGKWYHNRHQQVHHMGRVTPISDPLAENPSAPPISDRTPATLQHPRKRAAKLRTTAAQSRKKVGPTRCRGRPYDDQSKT